MPNDANPNTLPTGNSPVVGEPGANTGDGTAGPGDTPMTGPAAAAPANSGEASDPAAPPPSAPTPHGGMTSGEAAIEGAIRDKGLTAPRVTPDDIDRAIVGEEFHVFGGTTLTVCCLTLKNGFTVTGESACASVANYDKELGEQIARNNARGKIWALEGYLLKSVLAGHVHRA